MRTVWRAWAAFSRRVRFEMASLVLVVSTALWYGGTVWVWGWLIGGALLILLGASPRRSGAAPSARDAPHVPPA